MKKESNIIAAALAYAKRGWHVFPILAITQMGGCECGDECDKAGKHPAIKAWNKDASVDPEQIKEWWGQNPNRGIGIATGEISGITVLDVDGPEGVETLGNLPGFSGMATPCVESRPGRYHYYFQFEKGIKSNSQKLGKKLDTRSNGGYVVAPPSRHATGGQYKWLQDPETVALAEWPDFLKEGAAKAPSKRGRPAKETFNPANPKELKRLLEALAYVDPDDEERWGQAGWILGRAFHQSDSGFAEYAAWAGRSRKYDPKRTKQHYYERSREVRGSELKTTHSIFNWAKEAGWIDDVPSLREEREHHVFENPANELMMVKEFIKAATVAPRVFVMDKRLIRIVMYGASGADDAGIDRDPTAYIVWEHDTDTMAVELGCVAAYWALNKEGYKRSAFSRRAVQTFMAWREYTHEGNRIKQLDAFVSHPTLRADGTLLTQVGYDPTSRLFLTAEVPGLQVKQELTQKQATAAMQVLMEPFSEYPWASKVDRAVFVASIFTVGLRHLFEVTPLFAFSSPKHGSGKTQLAECLSRLWYGVTLSKATWTANPEEMEKRIASFLLAGDRIVCLDNVTEGQRLEDSTLNKVLTSRRNTFRILGKTERLELTNEATWFATGNQLMLSGDISRRALLCYIDAKVREPSARHFTIENLPLHILQHRAELMSAALSVVTSWVNAGRPVESPAPRAYGSFTDWYAWMRGMLLWVGEADLAEALQQVTDDDDDGMALEMFANVLRLALPPDGSRLKLPEVVRLFAKDNGLRSAFAGCVARDAEPNAKSVAGILRQCRNKIFVSDNPGHNFVIDCIVDKRSNTPLWGYSYV